MDYQIEVEFDAARGEGDVINYLAGMDEDEKRLAFITAMRTHMTNTGYYDRKRLEQFQVSDLSDKGRETPETKEKQISAEEMALLKKLHDLWGGEG